VVPELDDERGNMSVTRATARSGALVGAALLCVLTGLGGTAQAATDVQWIGYGYGNTHNGVLCVQEAIDNSPTPDHVSTDGVFGPETYAGIKAFQQWWNQHYDSPHLSVDGVVGPQTGDQMLGWVGAGCYAYVPTTD
jgi:peptidoglycan hydrolase-like protein with peptidoglycan-binding domain